MVSLQMSFMLTPNRVQTKLESSKSICFKEAQSEAKSAFATSQLKKDDYQS